MLDGLSHDSIAVQTGPGSWLRSTENRCGCGAVLTFEHCYCRTAERCTSQGKASQCFQKICGDNIYQTWCKYSRHPLKTYSLTPISNINLEKVSPYTLGAITRGRKSPPWEHYQQRGGGGSPKTTLPPNLGTISSSFLSCLTNGGEEASSGGCSICSVNAHM